MSSLHRRAALGLLILFAMPACRGTQKPTAAVADAAPSAVVPTASASAQSPRRATPAELARRCEGKDVDISWALSVPDCRSHLPAEATATPWPASLRFTLEPAAASVAPGTSIDVAIVIHNDGDAPVELAFDDPRGKATPGALAPTFALEAIDDQGRSNNTAAAVTSVVGELRGNKVTVRILPGGVARALSTFAAVGPDWDVILKADAGRIRDRWAAIRTALNPPRVPLKAGTYRLRLVHVPVLVGASGVAPATGAAPSPLPKAEASIRIE
jgi:hypothetical protein